MDRICPILSIAAELMALRVQNNVIHPTATCRPAENLDRVAYCRRARCELWQGVEEVGYCGLTGKADV